MVFEVNPSLRGDFVFDVSIIGAQESVDDRAE
jgi:hypothetical protein